MAEAAPLGEMEIRCADCDEPMICTAGTAVECWCDALPPQPIFDDAKGCFCPSCLQKRAAAYKAAQQTAPG
jgi:hypothetical protein